MKQEIVEKALQNLHQHKRMVENTYRNQMAPLLADKNYAELEKKYAKTMIENAREESLGKKIDRTEEENLKKAIRQYKIKANIAEQPDYACEICQDSGYVDGQMCKCLKQEISKVLLAGSGFEKLEDFEQSIKTSGELAPLYKKMQEWCNSNFNKNLIYIAGQTGVGKTHLMKCMANELINRNKVVKVVTAYKLNQDFKELSKNQDVLEKYLSSEILFIDDLGTEPIYKNITLESLYLVINERKMRNLPLVITSNLDMGDLMERYDERIYSRIADRETSITIKIDGKDKRIKK